MYELDFS